MSREHHSRCSIGAGGGFTVEGEVLRCPGVYLKVEGPKRAVDLRKFAGHHGSGGVLVSGVPQVECTVPITKTRTPEPAHIDGRILHYLSSSLSARVDLSPIWDWLEQGGGFKTANQFGEASIMIYQQVGDGVLHDTRYRLWSAPIVMGAEFEGEVIFPSVPVAFATSLQRPPDPRWKRRLPKILQIGTVDAEGQPHDWQFDLQGTDTAAISIPANGDEVLIAGYTVAELAVIAAAKDIRRPAYNWKDVSSEGVPGAAKMREQSTDGMSAAVEIHREFWNNVEREPLVRAGVEIMRSGALPEVAALMMTVNALVKQYNSALQQLTAQAMLCASPLIVKDLSKPEGEE